MENPISYFKGLNGIRAITAIGVMVSHIYKAQHHLGLNKTGSLPIGRYGVTVFFALSGFLITYLLLVEKEKTGAIAIKNFYFRRILRIWPLYFFYLFLCLFSYQYIFQEPVEYIYYLPFFLLFLPNIPFSIDRCPQSTDHLWSIGIEEQFYIFWPVVIRKVKSIKRFIYIFLSSVIIIKILAMVWARIFHLHVVESIFSNLRYDCMAIGGWFALMTEDDRLKDVIKKYRYFIIFAFYLFFVSAFYKPYMEVFHIFTPDIISILTCLFIYTQIFYKGASSQLLEHRYLKYLGMISFGIYVYHPLVLAFFQFILFEKCQIQFGHIAVLVTLISVSTIFVSGLSYQYLEKYFLRLKANFSTEKRYLI